MRKVKNFVYTIYLIKVDNESEYLQMISAPSKQ